MDDGKLSQLRQPLSARQPLPGFSRETARLSRYLSVRCGDCSARFVARTWDLSVLTHSRCPKCLRMDLNVWTEEQYWPSVYMRFLITLGAHPWALRLPSQFCVVRPRLERFSFNRWRGERGRGEWTGLLACHWLRKKSGTACSCAQAQKPTTYRAATVRERSPFVFFCSPKEPCQKQIGSK